MTSSGLLEGYLDSSRQLYTLPAIAVDVLALLREPHVDASQIRSRVELDPALSAKLLRVVNSSLYGLSRPVTNLHQAISLLGLKPLKLLVLGFTLPDGLFLGLGGEALARYWRRTLTRAVAARELSELVRPQESDEAFLAGLLSDIGKLVLIQSLGESYVDLLANTDIDGRELAAIERSTLGYDHREVTVGILQGWHLPEILVSAVERGDHAGVMDECGQPTLVWIVEFADRLAEVLEGGRLAALADHLAGQPLVVGDLPGLAMSIETKTEQLADVLALDLAGGRAYQDVLDEAYRSLARVATDCALELTHAGNRDVVERTTRLMQGEAARSLAQAAGRLHRSHSPMAEAVRDRELEHSPSQPARRGVPNIETCDETSHPGIADGMAAGELARCLAAAVIRCRTEHLPLSVLLVEVDHHGDLVMQCGPHGAQRLLESLVTAARGLDLAAESTWMRDGLFAVILPGLDRMRAVVAGHELVEQARSNKKGLPVSISVGVATVAAAPRNFPPLDLARAAQRCLYAAQAAAGGCVKSIEIY